LIGLALAALVTERPWRRSQVTWSTNLDAALTQAQATGKPVFVEVYAAWCGPCHMMDRDTFTDPEVGRELKGFFPVHFDSDGRGAAGHMRAWQADVLPTHLVLNSDGSLRAKTYGAMGPKQFLAWLRSAEPRGRD
ncbi:MAG TPA: thioredoxin family protein, partial [Fimbriimonadaceae bacterium]|nr:thioredoxin family protein [Fimbriimonadaceae bacterium]